MHRFLMVVEKANGSYSTYPPGLLRCVATGETREEAEGNASAEYVVIRE